MKLLLLFLLSSTIVAVDTNLRGVQASESELYVHNFIGVDGNWTYVEKPFFPVFLNSSQIEIGKNWSIVCSLVSGKSYHVYCYGSWVSSISVRKRITTFTFLIPKENWRANIRKPLVFRSTWEQPLMMLCLFQYNRATTRLLL